MSDYVWQARPDHSLVIRTSYRIGSDDPLSPRISVSDREGLIGRVASSFRSAYQVPFLWPEEPGAWVFAEDFDPRPHCGGGLHGLEWGRGLRSYLGDSRDPATVFQVIDVAHADMVRIPAGLDEATEFAKVKFRGGTLVYSGGYSGAVQLIADNTPTDPEAEKRVSQLSEYPHRMYALGPAEELNANKYEDAMDGRVETANVSGADLISSEITGRRKFAGDRESLRGGRRNMEDDTVIEQWDGDPLLPGERVAAGFHTVMLDIDLPARLEPSGTPGHFHLYIDKAMPWTAYQDLLIALGLAGILEPGYVRASIHRKASHLRVPTRPKELSPE